MDMLKEIPKIKKTMKIYNFNLGRITHFRLLNPSTAIKKTRHKNTEYYYFECEVISKDNEHIPCGNHTIQLPSKRVVFPLIRGLEKQKRMKEPVEITINRNGSYDFNLTIHKQQ